MLPWRSIFYMVESLRDGKRLIELRAASPTISVRA